MPKMITSNDQFVFRFMGDNSIDAFLLGRAILDLSLISKEVAEIDGEPGKYSLRVEAMQTGSFEIFFQMVWDATSSLLPHVTLQNVTHVITIIRHLFEIKKHLRGEKPKSVETVGNTILITTSDGSKVEAPIGTNILFENRKVDQCVTEVSKIAILSNAHEGFSMADKLGESFFSVQDAHNIAHEQEFVDFRDTESAHSERVMLPIKSPDLLGNSKWKFLYGKRSITATINDTGFLNQMHAREVALQSGDKLDVNLEIQTKKSPTGEVILESYRIAKVHRTVPLVQGEQTKLPGY